MELALVDLDELQESMETVVNYGDRAHDRANRWRRYAVTTFIALVVIWAGFLAYVMLTPVKTPVLVGRTMTIHCPSEDGGRPGCVWDTLTDGNGRGDPDGPRWLVWP